VLDRGLEVLGKDLVGLVEGLPEPTYYAVDRFQLSFYRNMTIHLFISEALVSASMYAKVKQGGSHKKQRISIEDLRAQVLFLSQLFRGEFIYPTEGLAVNLVNTLDGLEADNVITLERNDKGEVTTVGISDAERAAGRENFDFYCFLIWPFIEASWLGAVSLMGVTPALGQSNDNWVDVAKAQNSAQLVSTIVTHNTTKHLTHFQLGKTLYHQGDLSYFEAVNKETLKNAYQRFEEEGILQVSKSRISKTPPKMRLAPDWVPRRDPLTGNILPEGRLWDFTELIAHSRREGKNRRDGATVSTRVLRLADDLGAKLFDNIGKDADVEVGKKRSEGRRKIAAVQAKAHL
jgi:hypothetical protein